MQSENTHADQVLILAYNESGLLPGDAQRLKRLFHSRGVKPVSVRITPEYVEVQVYRGDYSRAVRLVEKNIGAVLEVSRPAPRGGLGDLEKLFTHKLFWRAHTLAEEKWRETGDEYYRLLAVLAAAMAKAQEGERAPAERLVDLATRIAREIGVALDEECLRREVGDMVESGSGNPLRCLGGRS